MKKIICSLLTLIDVKFNLKNQFVKATIGIVGTSKVDSIKCNHFSRIDTYKKLNLLNILKQLILSNIQL